MADMDTTKWFSELEKRPNVDYIHDEIYLTDDPSIIPLIGSQNENEGVIACICMQGEFRIQINLVSICAKASSMLILLPHQPFQYEGFSEDFQGVFVIMGKQLTKKIDIPDSLPVSISIRRAPCFMLQEKELDAFLNFYKMIQGVLQNNDEGFNRKAIVKHLIIALFYGFGYYLHKSLGKNLKTRRDIIIDDFLKLVQKHYKQERSISFYAERMCYTPKYLSEVIKNGSGKSAGRWINDYVILEAKLLLKSTDLTVQQISDELNFPSQSFFGKYFKREVGMSPNLYRKD